MQLWAGIQKYFKCTSFSNVDFQKIIQMLSFLQGDNKIRLQLL